jgi:hypothetical protein
MKRLTWLRAPAGLSFVIFAITGAENDNTAVPPQHVAEAPGKEEPRQ